MVGALRGESGAQHALLSNLGVGAREHMLQGSGKLCKTDASGEEDKAEHG